MARTLRERVLIAAWPGTAQGTPAILGERLRLDDGADLLATEFHSVTRHDYTGELTIPGPGPVEDYVRSMVVTQDLPEPEDLVAAVTSIVCPSNQKTFRIRTQSGCLVCT